MMCLRITANDLHQDTVLIGRSQTPHSTKIKSPFPYAENTMTQYVSVFSGEYRKYWTQDKYGYTDQPKDFGWWSEDEAKEIISCIGADKKLELIPYFPTQLQLALRQRKAS